MQTVNSNIHGPRMTKRTYHAGPLWYPLYLAGRFLLRPFGASCSLWGHGDRYVEQMEITWQVFLNNKFSGNFGCLVWFK